MIVGHEYQCWTDLVRPLKRESVVRAGATHAHLRASHQHAQRTPPRPSNARAGPLPARRAYSSSGKTMRISCVSAEALPSRAPSTAFSSGLRGSTSST